MSNSPLQIAAASLVVRAVALMERAGLANHFTVTLRVQGRQVSVKIEAVPVGKMLLDRDVSDDDDE
jgi:hypothetical protein